MRFNCHFSCSLQFCWNSIDWTRWPRSHFQHLILWFVTSCLWRKSTQLCCLQGCGTEFASLLFIFKGSRSACYMCTELSERSIPLATLSQIHMWTESWTNHFSKYRWWIRSECMKCFCNSFATSASHFSNHHSTVSPFHFAICMRNILFSEVIATLFVLD